MDAPAPFEIGSDNVDAELPNGSWVIWAIHQAASRCTTLGNMLAVAARAGCSVTRDDPADLSDVILESALSTIVDLKDSIAAVDAQAKVAAYPTGWAWPKANRSIFISSDLALRRAHGSAAPSLLRP